MSLSENDAHDSVPSAQYSLHGCVPILCTPFTDDGAVDHESLKSEIDWVIAEGATGVAGLAIASEGYKLTDAERDQVAETIVAHTAGRVPVVLSADGAGTDVAVDRARRVTAAGADYVMVLPPYFVKPDAKGLRDYYRRVGEACAPAGLIIQDAPQLTGVAMAPTLWAELADIIPNLASIKVEGTPQGATISAARRLTNDRLAVFCGWGGLGIIDALERGSAGSMPAPNFTRLFADIQRHYEADNRAEAEALVTDAMPFLVWAMQSIDHSVTTAKTELHRLGVFTSAHVRQPAVALDDVAQDQLNRFLREPTVVSLPQ